MQTNKDFLHMVKSLSEAVSVPQCLVFPVEFVVRCVCVLPCFVCDISSAKAFIVLNKSTK